ncbi:hypothetical protein K435DRAFT_793093 [Dendrothele bispora CBS 962.96]|uniref:Uncharacterized protein n=1 Tax=Dendrothele bispora (strain CBS 962.96) TaxID=1314807 RepID=A0A4S8MGV2_DENBC|nr:hypothetical protein K435DRAFT_793093 [Dendrothele bispora CBS 962.96]
MGDHSLSNAQGIEQGLKIMKASTSYSAVIFLDDPDEQVTLGFIVEEKGKMLDGPSNPPKPIRRVNLIVKRDPVNSESDEENLSVPKTQSKKLHVESDNEDEHSLDEIEKIIEKKEEKSAKSKASNHLFKTGASSHRGHRGSSGKISTRRKVA